MRKALVVGLNHYLSCPDLHGCTNDALSVKSLLERNYDGSVNFDARLLISNDSSNIVSKIALKSAVKELFTGDADTALFYFAGHGYIEVTGGYLITSECSVGDDGLPLTDVLFLANESKARNKVIILDSCHSGFAGSSLASAGKCAELTEGITILTASTEEQYASEENGSGVFTTLLVDALSGAAANIVGDVTPGSVYAHIDQSLGPWEQRPVFKTNVKSFVSLRKTRPAIEINDLHRMAELFPDSGYEFNLDPTFEPELKGRDPGMPDPLPDNVMTFHLLQKYNRLNLLVPVGAPHMWHAAMQSKSCRLTALGEHYRRLVVKGRI